MAMNEEEVGRLVVRILGEDKDYQRMLRNIKQSTQSTFDRMRQMGKRLTIGLTAPLLGVGALAVKSFADFDDAMHQSIAIMGDLEQETVTRMANVAKELATGGKVNKSATELAESYFFLASAGKNAEQSMALLEPVAKFATAGMFDMAKATDLLTDAQSALGMTMKDPQQDMQEMVRLSDTLVKANTLANASVEQFATSLTTKAGSSFKNFNISLENGTALLAAYADQGIKAELAGNAADRMIRLLTKAVAENAQVFKDLKVEVFDSTGEFRDFDAIVRDIENATRGMSTEAKAATLTQLGFEARVQQVILPLIGASDNLKKYRERIGDVGDVTKDVAEKQMKSFANQMKVVKNNIGVLLGEIGSRLAPILMSLGRQVTELTTWFRGLSDETKTVIGVIAALTATIGPLMLVIGALGPSVIRGATALRLLATSATTARIAMMGLKAGIAGFAIVLGAQALGNITGFNQRLKEMHQRLQDLQNAANVEVGQIQKRLQFALKDAAGQQDPKKQVEIIVKAMQELGDKQIEFRKKMLEAEKSVREAGGPEIVGGLTLGTIQELMGTEGAGNPRLHEALKNLEEFKRVEKAAREAQNTLQEELFSMKDRANQNKMQQALGGGIQQAAQGLNQLSEAQQEATDTAKELLQTWLDQQKTLRMTARETELYHLKRRLNNDTLIGILEIEEKHLTKLEEEQDLLEKSKRLYQDLLSPMDRYKQRLEEIAKIAMVPGSAIGGPMQFQQGNMFPTPNPDFFKALGDAAEGFNLVNNSANKAARAIGRFNHAAAGSAEDRTRLEQWRDFLKDQGLGLGRAGGDAPFVPVPQPGMQPIPAQNLGQQGGIGVNIGGVQAGQIVTAIELLRQISQKVGGFAANLP